MFVIYRSFNEVIITTRKKEEKMIREYFERPGGPSISEYIREVTSGYIVLTSEISL